MNPSPLEVRKNGQETTIYCSGEWILDEARRIEKEITQLTPPQTTRCFIDFHEVTKFDSAGILLLLQLREAMKKAGHPCEIIGLDEKQSKMLRLIERGYGEEPLPKRRETLLWRIGKATLDELGVMRDFFHFLGELSIRTLGLFVNPSNFRIRETVYHIEHSGVDALFIIGLTAFLVGLVIAYESLVQLMQFGADIYVVDGIGIAITRELGPMITAIVIAGRSASAYAAEIGTMKITEEISAMRTMGFDPFYFLIIPRILALMIALPLLIFFSDITGILGGMIATKAQVDISFSFFINRLQEVLAAKHYILGIVKGPFFALIIAATGCFHGFRVTGDTESIGIETTASVVHAIFFVIACDALFAVIYTQLGY
ncbi:MlaE family lipid ABC transporter permease subunit [Nitratifractor sp.]|uniref:ABC transporter permease n=1 Tax=Nitratifractor sp. TaxID=2268144 RepID=UPI002600636F|nr:MlaE family lipid ABC transporter permease subunit [Nitratifractor sp.]